MLPLLLGTTVFLILMAGIFIPLEGWCPRRTVDISARTALLCVGLLFLDVLAMEWIGGAVLDSLGGLGSALAGASGLRIAGALGLAELAGYAIHRLMHRVPWVWRVTMRGSCQTRSGWPGRTSRSSRISPSASPPLAR